MSEKLAENIKGKKITIVDVAKMAGVVPSTVSHVINGTAKITEETKARVLSAIEQLNYTPNASARALRQKRTRMIGVALQNISSEFYAKCAATMLREARKDDYALMVMDACFDNHNLKAQVTALIERRVEGLVFIGGGNDDEILQEALNYGIPIVLGDRNDMRFSSVDYNNEETVYNLVRALYDSGYRKFAYASEPVEIQKNLEERYHGYEAGLDQCKVPQKDRLLVMTEQLHISKLDRSLNLFKERFLDKDGKLIPEVIVTSNDMIAHGFILAALRLGIRVPEELAVVGFDDIEISKYFIPALTTIAQDEAELGKSCYKLLKNIIDGKAYTREHIVLGQKIRNRESAKLTDEAVKKYFHSF